MGDSSRSLSRRQTAESNDSHSRAALSATASKTGWTLLGELLMTLRISEVAVCCSSASASFIPRSSRDLRLRPTRTLAFVPVERSLRPRVGLFAPLRDKVTSSAQSLAPLPVGPAKDRAYQS